MAEVYVLLACLDEWYASYSYEKSFSTAKEMKNYIQSMYAKGEFVYKVDDRDYQFNNHESLVCYTKTPIRRKDSDMRYSLMIHKDEI